jgi:hypothetical protein
MANFYTWRSLCDLSILNPIDYIASHLQKGCFHLTVFLCAQLDPLKMIISSEISALL